MDGGDPPGKDTLVKNRGKMAGLGHFHKGSDPAAGGCAGSGEEIPAVGHMGVGIDQAREDDLPCEIKNLPGRDLRFRVEQSCYFPVPDGDGQLSGTGRGDSKPVFHEQVKHGVPPFWVGDAS